LVKSATGPDFWPFGECFTSLAAGNEAGPSVDLLAWLIDEVQRRAAAMVH